MNRFVHMDRARRATMQRRIAVIPRPLDLGHDAHRHPADAYGPYTNEELGGKSVVREARERAVLATRSGCWWMWSDRRTDRHLCAGARTERSSPSTLRTSI